MTHRHLLGQEKHVRRLLVQSFPDRSVCLAGQDGDAPSHHPDRWSAPDGKFEDRASTFAINRDLPTPDFQLLRKEGGAIEIVTERLHLLWDGKDFSPSSLHVLLRNKGESAWSQFDPFQI
jgi:hypothetical protein